VYPSLTYHDVGAALTWLAEAFGFEAQVIDGDSAIVRSGSGTVLIQADRPAGITARAACPVRLWGILPIAAGRVIRPSVGFSAGHREATVVRYP
jgi:hypothetical protein